MVRRRAFLNNDFIAESKNFVCVRMNPWLDQVNVNRITSMLGRHQNTAIALVRPDARGVAVDDFPTTDDCYWQMYVRGRAAKTIETVEGADQITGVMGELARSVTLKPGAEEGLPLLPVHPDIVQTLNLGACDGRMVVAEVDGVELIEPKLRALVFDDELAGTAHYVRMSAEDWQKAIDAGLIKVDESLGKTGVFIVMPEPFGLWGQVLTHVPVDATSEDLRTCMTDGLTRFRHEFHKEDRSKHLLMGRRDNFLWNEYNPTVAAAQAQQSDKASDM